MPGRRPTQTPTHSLGRDRLLMEHCVSLQPRTGTSLGSLLEAVCFPRAGPRGQPGGSDLLWKAFGHLVCCAAPSCEFPSALNPVGVTTPLQEQEASESVGAQRTSPTPAPGRRL